MGGRDEDAPSFDPHTWRGALPIAGEPGAAAQSFDPKTWAPEATEAEPKPKPKPKRNGPEPTAPSRGRHLAAWAAGASILVVGAAVALIHRTPPSAPPPAAAAAPAAEAPKDLSSSRRTLRVAGPDQVPAAVAAIGIAPETAREATAHVLAAIGPGPGEIRLAYELAGPPGAPTLLSLEATRDDGAGIVLTPAGGAGFAVRRLAAHLTARIRSVTGEMDATNFYSSAVTAGINDSLITDFANAFSFEFDFQREVQAGDVFEAAIEESLNPAGEPVGQPRLLFASLQTAAKSLRLYRFIPPGETQAGWFDPNGRSNVRSLMRTPVDGARLSSTFGYRLHPILGYMKLHRGTDFAAPIGTPIYASGNAVVVFAQPRGAAGKMVRLQHDNGWFTHYFHLNRFGAGLAPGARVTQGQQIGEVGTSGRSTGPHLHYEVWIDGQPVDSQKIDTGSGRTLAGAALAAFKAQREKVDRARGGAR